MISFADFLRAAHGKDLTPYPWQVRLAERCAEHEPPAAIAVPTGAGKTTTIDALVWALAQQAERPAAQRTVGVRIVWAIDRRILVDEVYEHAVSLARILKKALGDDGDPLHEMATRLEALSSGKPLVATPPDGTPLVATRWRGGLQERPERCGPLQPQVITSTIAQIGSRLLFRGYGIGKRSLALEAGLAACDTTICLDEAHLVEPFRKTVEAIWEHRQAGERGLELPGLRTITLTATPPRDTQDTITLDEHDRAALGRRYTGKKQAELLTGDSSESAQVKLLAARSAGYVHEGHPTVACIVNTVRRARAVFDALNKELGDEVDVALLIGPQRPADRDRVLGKHRATLFGGAVGERPLICVATQTFEVGLDADVAAMVTESASATALVQRLGRLNRRGEIVGRATIVREEGNPLYVDDEPAAWSWLQELADESGVIDVSVAALIRNPPPLPSHPPCVSKLTAEIVERFVETSPRSGGLREPDPDVFLRGPEAKATAEVALCWRCDLRPDTASRRFDEYRFTLLKLVPPQRGELLTLSLSAARALLAARYPGDAKNPRAARTALLDADVEDATSDGADWTEYQRERGVVPFVILRGEDLHKGTLDPGARDVKEAETSEPEAIGPFGLRPGDVLVLPTLAGGVDDNGLAPMQPHGEHASDVAEDRRPGSQALDTPAPVRLTPEALAPDRDRQLEPADWQRVAESCARAEKELVNMTGQSRRAQTVGRLIKRLLEEPALADHAGLRRLLLQDDTWAAALRSVTPADDADGTLRLDETDFGADAEEDRADADEVDPGGSEAEEQEEGFDSDAQEDFRAARLKSERVWVLLPERVKHKDSVSGHGSDELGRPTIDQHAIAVSQEVRACARQLQMTAELGGALVLAALAHDHGKADPRTQVFYRRGVKGFASKLIAKSEFGTRDPRTERIAKQLADLPKRQRHEIASVAVLDDALASRTVRMDMDGVDGDLALYLIGVHHGLGRPVPDVPEGGSPAQPFAIDAAGIAGSAVGDGRDGWADGAWLERFWRVFDRYGPWGTAYLEALLVLSDRVVSSRGG